MSNSQQDRQLIDRLLARQKNAWHDFVRQFEGLVYARVARTLQQLNRPSCNGEIDDICAEVFASLLANDLRSLRQFQGRSSLATWLSVVARRVCLRFVSRRSVDSAAYQESARRRWRTDDTSVLQQLIRREDLQQLNSKMRLLKQSDRRILRFYFNEQLSYREISRRLNISVNSVGPKLSRAQRRLRELMESA